MPERTPDDAPLPAEARAVQGHAPAPTNVLNVPVRGAPTPGLAFATLKAPGAPSLPEWDPASASVVIARMATELYREPPASSADSLPLPEGERVGERAYPNPAHLPSVGSTNAVVPSSGGVPTSGVVPWTAAPTSNELPWGEGVASSTVPTSGAPTSGVPSSGVPTNGFSPTIEAAPLAPASSNPHPDPLPRGGEGDRNPFGSAPTFDSLFGPVAPLISFPLVETAAPASAPQPTAARSPAPWQLDTTAPRFQQSRGVFDPYALRREFPILDQQVNGRPLVWLDNAATTQKPQTVIDRLTYFYENENSNVHRAAHTLAARASDAYESARESVRRFLNAPSAKDIIFVRGATEGINLVAQSWGRRYVNEGDELVITWLEHHANIVPWQQLAAEKGAKLKVAPVDDRGQVILEEYEKLLGPKTRLVAFTQVSNALGTITPAREMIEMAHRHGAKVLLDGAQAVSHLRVDVQALDCDFFVFSGHKVFAPTGIGAVFGKGDLLSTTPPWQGGGNMIADVTFERTVYQAPPGRFEAGTGNIADAVGLGAALDWLTRVGLENVARYEHELLEYATERLLGVPGLRMYGTAPEKAGVLSFTLEGQKTEEMSAALDKEGIAVRSGHHCAQPILRRLGVEATVRASLAPYNTFEDLDALVAALHRLQAGR